MDNLNMNISNTIALKNFLHHAQEVREGLNDKYQDGEFTDPSTIDPLVEVDKKKTWAD